MFRMICRVDIKMVFGMVSRAMRGIRIVRRRFRH